MEEGSGEHKDVLQPINYGEQGYWDNRYEKRKGQRFEWLQSYPSLKPHLQNYLPNTKNSRILNVGCGNGTLQQSLYEDGYHCIVNNDISAVVIEQMREAAQSKGLTEMKFDVMDVREMSYTNQSFDLVIDKSTIDTLMCSDNPLINVAKMIEEGYRVLKDGGYYFTVSYSANRKEHFMRQHVRFEVVKKELRRVSEQGLDVVNHLYICKKLPMDRLTAEGRQQFYRQLKQLQDKEYPPV